MRSAPTTRRSWGVVVLFGALLVDTGCRKNLECFGTSECPNGKICVAGACVVPDAGFPDAGPDDAAIPEAGPPDAEPPDAGPLDTGDPDGGTPDTGFPDAGFPDVGFPDVGFPDAGFPDTGPIDPVTGAGSYQHVGGGLLFGDGPIWSEAEQAFLFSDWGSGADRLFRYDGVVAPYRVPGNQTGGLAVDPSTGELIAAEMETRRISRTTNGMVVPVAVDYQGGQLNGPNDVVVRSDGTIYFTDPPYGLFGRVRELPFNGLFRIATGTTTGTTAPVLEWQGDQVQDQPNGIALSPNEAVLYVGNTSQQKVEAFDVMPDGSLSNRRAFATTGLFPDGMAVDELGNIYVTTAGGIEVFRPDGSSWGVIPGPPNGVQGTNLAFGGADGRTVFVTTPSDVYVFRAAIPGGAP